MQNTLGIPDFNDMDVLPPDLASLLDESKNIINELQSRNDSLNSEYIKKQNQKKRRNGNSKNDKKQ